MSGSNRLRNRESVRQAAPVLLVGGGVFLVALARTGSPTLAAAVGVVSTLFLGPPVWVWWDAQKLGLRHPLAWGVFALLTTPIGSVVYYLLRPDTVAHRECTSCRRSVLERFSACPWCGTPCETEVHSCGSCHASVEADWSFCPYCRVPLEAEAATPAAPSTPEPDAGSDLA